jgi:hypothetical protein
MLKYGFKIKTRGGMVVDNLLVSAQDRSEAERKIMQIYHHCEILHCHEAQQPLRDDSQGLSLENAIALISREPDVVTPAKSG